MKSCDNHFTDLLDLPLSGKMPASKEIRGKIRTLVKNGALRANSQLPSTKTLAELFGVFPNTVQLALEPLVREGLLDRRQNRGRLFVKGVVTSFAWDSTKTLTPSHLGTAISCCRCRLKWQRCWRSRMPS